MDSGEAEKRVQHPVVASRWIATLTLGVAAAAIFYFWGGVSSQRLVAWQDDLVLLREASPWGAVLIAFSAYVIVAAFSIPGAALLSLFLGWWLGFWMALIVVSFGSTAGATAACAMSRYLFKDWVRTNLSEKLEEVLKGWERHGSLFLWSLRLIPAIPFWVVNLVMGLTTIRLRTFWWVSQLAMLPATVIYVYAGSKLPSLSQLQERGGVALISPGMLVAMLGLALLPLLTIGARKWLPRGGIARS